MQGLLRVEVWVIRGLLVVVINGLLVSIHRLLVLLRVHLAHLPLLTIVKPIVNYWSNRMRVKVGWLLSWVNRLSLDWELCLLLELVPKILKILLCLIVLLLDNLLFLLLNDLLARYKLWNFLLLWRFTLRGQLTVQKQYSVAKFFAGPNLLATDEARAGAH